MGYKDYSPPQSLLFGYDPASKLSSDHLARLVEKVVETVAVPRVRSPIGQRGYDPRMLAKVMIYGYATGTFSSRRIAQNCREHLAYLFLTRGEGPCFRTLCMARTEWKAYLREIWLALNATALSSGVKLSGELSLDATRLKANASNDLVVEDSDYEELERRFEELLTRAARLDDEEGTAAPSETGVEVSRIVVRKVVRSLGKALPEGELTLRGRKRFKECVATLKKAKKEGLRKVSLSDPDARLMPLGSHRAISMGHALEVAVDSGVIVAGSSLQEAADHGRLLPLTQAARANDPSPIVEVKADSGYFDADQIVTLEDQGLQILVPDSVTASHMRKRNFPAQEEIEFKKLPERDAYVCPEGNVLRFKAKDGSRKQYQAKNECGSCPLAEKCLKRPNAKRRSLWIRPQVERIVPYLAQFRDPEFRRRYYARGPGVETVFAFIRAALGFTRWSVRGKEKVSAEAEILKCAYQLRKIHKLKLQPV